MMKKLVLAIACMPLCTLYAVPLTMLSPSALVNGPVSITTPGLYVLSDDVEGVPLSALNITTSDVILDLNGKSIRGATTSNTGITVTNAFENITIKNGSIVGFANISISVAAGSKNLTFENLLLSGTSRDSTVSKALFLNGTAGSTTRTTNVTIRNCRMTTGNIGMRAIATDDVIMENCTCNDNGFFGIAALDCQNWTLKNCQASGNSTASSSQTLGLLARKSSNWHVKDSDFSFNVNAQRGTGVLLDSGSSAHIFENCTFNNNGATGNAAIEVEGINPSITFSCLFRNCVANGNFATTTTAAGFRFDASGFGNVAENCVAIGNNTTSNAFNAYGFLITGAMAGVGLINCKAQGNSALSPALGIGFGIGSGVNATVANCVVRDCFSFSNSHTGFSVDSSTVFLIGNLAADNPTNYDGTAVAGGTVGSVRFANGAQPGSAAFDTRNIDNIAYGAL